jgi:hypothetical protein
MGYFFVHFVVFSDFTYACYIVLLKFLSPAR